MRKKLVLSSLFICAFVLVLSLINHKEIKENKPTSIKVPEPTQEKKVPSPTPQVFFKQPGASALLMIPVYVHQTFNNCGPATLSMMLSYYGTNVSQKEVGEAMRPYQQPKGNNDDKTIFPEEMVSYAKKYGYFGLSRPNGTIYLLKKFTTNGIPVIVRTWLHTYDDIGHFRIVTGFDDKNKVIIQDDSYEAQGKKIPYEEFNKLWQPFNYGYIVIYQKSKQGAVEEILGPDYEEKTAWQAAQKRALTELNLNNGSIYSGFNLSVSLYYLGEYRQAIEEFEKIENQLPRRMLWYQLEPILAYQKLGSYDRVLSLTEKILNDNNRAFSELYQIRGEVYFAVGDKIKAKEEFEKAIFYNKNFLPAQRSIQELGN